MNSTLNAADIELDIELDPDRMRSEYLADFRQDQNSLFQFEKIERATDKGIFERDYDDTQLYTAALDASSGSAKNFLRLAIAQRDENDRCILDLVKEARPLFDPEEAKEYSALIEQYRCHSIFADKWSFVWVQQAFARASNERIEVEDCGVDRSVIYARTAPLFNSGRVSLIENARLQERMRELAKNPPVAARTVSTPPAGKMRTSPTPRVSPC